MGVPRKGVDALMGTGLNEKYAARRVAPGSVRRVRDGAQGPRSGTARKGRVQGRRARAAFRDGGWPSVLVHCTFFNMRASISSSRFL